MEGRPSGDPPFREEQRDEEPRFADNINISIVIKSSQRWIAIPIPLRGFFEIKKEGDPVGSPWRFFHLSSPAVRTVFKTSLFSPLGRYSTLFFGTTNA